jgi:hypothetical protein
VDAGDLLVGAGELPAETLREEAAHRGLAAAGEADEDDGGVHCAS